ncbi:hypothetical protein MBLL_04737 (plasmid) [Methylobacterium bullatum]|uniref:Uncharacterized protein n=1 Tax=Methylobacterium bullatum TaxID=570505 RepID=A0A679K7N2_9HYPH|nr:hypothetical protein MBLL_04737 [Methylobacterium bullatum]
MGDFNIDAPHQPSRRVPRHLKTDLRRPTLVGCYNPTEGEEALEITVTLAVRAFGVQHPADYTREVHLVGQQ